jgi:alpha-tubulin suppressor-like RCC1 family protein
MMMKNRKQAKRLLAALLAMALCLSFGAGTAGAAEPTLTAEASYTTNTVTADPTRSWAIDQNGTLWGIGANGETFLSQPLGDGTTTKRTQPVKIMDNVQFIDYTYAIKTDGSLWAWGFGQDGGLNVMAESGWYSVGDGTTETRISPVKIMDDVAQVSAERFDGSYALKTDGSLWGWGSHFYGIDGRLADKQASPILVMENVKFINDELAIKTDNSLWGWGAALPKHYEDRAPAKIMDDVVWAYTDGYKSVAIKLDGSLWGWGDGVKAAVLGISVPESESIQETPVKLMDGGVKSLVFGGSSLSGNPYSFVLKTDGSLWVAGSYYNMGAIDNPLRGTTTLVKPTKVWDDVAAIHMAGGALFILTKDGTVYQKSTGAVIAGFKKPFMRDEVSTVFTNVALPATLSFKPNTSITPANEPSPWAKAEVEEALALGIVWESQDLARAWRSTATRRNAAMVLGQTLEQIIGPNSSGDLSVIAQERGWEIFDHSADFDDVSADASPGSYEIIFLKHAGVVSGVGGNRYDPDGAYTRAQAAAMIGRAAQVFFDKQITGANPFSDVPDWAAACVGYAVEAGITGGIGGGKFGSDDPLTNEQLVIFALRAYKAWK